MSTIKELLEEIAARLIGSERSVEKTPDSATDAKVITAPAPTNIVSLEDITARGLDPYYSPDEVFRMLQSLSREEFAKIKRNARVHIHRTKLDRVTSWEDLTQEAYLRVCDGTRRWRRDKDAVQFLSGVYGVIRSVASHEAEQFKEHVELVDEMTIDSRYSNSCDLASVLGVNDILELGKKRLEDDPIAQSIFMLMAWGYERKEIMQKLNLSQQRVDSKVRFIQRRLEELRMRGRK